MTTTSKTKGSYPIIIKASRQLVQEFQECELGRYEDKSVAIERGENVGEDAYPDAVTWEILDRRKQDIEICNEEELREIRWTIGSGTTSLYSWGMYRAAKTLIVRVEEAARLLGVEFTELERTWPDHPEFAVGEKMT